LVAAKVRESRLLLNYCSRNTAKERAEEERSRSGRERRREQEKEREEGRAD
jgi:hypothetical protein